MDDERLYQVALSMIPGIGDIMAKTLVSYCGSAKEVFKKNKSQLAKLPGFGTFHAEKILNFRDFSKAENEIVKCEKHRVEIIFFTDKKYPKKLKHAPDSPTLLYYKGKVISTMQKPLPLSANRLVMAGNSLSKLLRSLPATRL